MRRHKAIKMVCGLVFMMAVLGMTGCAAKKPGAIVVDQISSTATVIHIDAAARTVTLKFEDGQSHAFLVSDAVKNFDQIKVGDKVKSTYLEAVAIFVRKAGEEPVAKSTSTVEIAPRGAKPGAVISNVREISARVTAIDYNKRSVTITDLKGDARTILVNESVEQFKNVKVGDDLVLQITTAVILAVEKP